MASAFSPADTPLTGAVRKPEVELGAGVALLGGQAVPPDGFSVVLRQRPDRCRT